LSTNYVSSFVPGWMNGAIRRAIRKRNRFQRQAKKSNLPVHWVNFRKSRNKTTNIIRRQKELYFDNLIAYHQYLIETKKKVLKASAFSASS
jgi:hypothetical protein